MKGSFYSRSPFLGELWSSSREEHQKVSTVGAPLPRHVFRGASGILQVPLYRSVCSVPARRSAPARRSVPARRLDRGDVMETNCLELAF